MKQLVALLMIAFMVPTAAMAKNGACKADKAKFCKEAKAAGGNMRDCLKQHAAEVSAACKTSLDKPKDAKSKDDKAKKGESKTPGAAEKPSEATKPADAMKPAETMKPTETKPAEAPKASAPASPGGSETKP
jgi:hypothetical protein